MSRELTMKSSHRKSYLSLKQFLKENFKTGEFTFFAVMTHHHSGEGLEVWKKEFYELLEAGFIVKTGDRPLCSAYSLTKEEG